MRKIEFGPRPTNRDELARWYAAVLAAQAKSGLSIAAFAGRLGVSVPTLYLWRRRLGPQPGSDDVPARLVEVTVTRSSPTAPAAAPGAMVVRLCAGRRSIEVPSGFDDAELRRLVAAVESC